MEFVEELKEKIEAALVSDSGETLLESHAMEFTPPKPIGQTQLRPRAFSADERQLLAFAQGRCGSS